MYKTNSINTIYLDICHRLCIIKRMYDVSSVLINFRYQVKKLERDKY